MYMKCFFTAVLMVGLLVLSGCYGQEEKISLILESQNQNAGDICTISEEFSTTPQARVITPQEAEILMDGDSTIILDVRTPGEFEEGHIRNAVLLPLNELLERIESIVPNKDYTILIYCRSGNRSNVAKHLLSEMGYTSVFDFGGILSWHGEIVVG